MRFLRILLLAILGLAPLAAAHGTVVLNNLSQIGLATHKTVFGVTGDISVACGDGSVRTISDGDSVICGDGSVRLIGGDTTIACADGSVRTLSGAESVYCGDGSVRTVPGDGSVRFIAPDQGTGTAVCVANVLVPGRITDGTSNTIAFGESRGLRIVPGFVSPHTSVHDIVDGTSNTILFGETPGSGFCLGNTTIGDPFVGAISDGSSNTIFLGDDSRLDICFPRARIGRVSDGSSNTLLFGDVQSNVCLENVRVGDDLAVAGVVAEPATLVLLLPALFGLGVVLRRYRQL